MSDVVSAESCKQHFLRLSHRDLLYVVSVPGNRGKGDSTVGSSKQVWSRADRCAQV